MSSGNCFSMCCGCERHHVTDKFCSCKPCTAKRVFKDLGKAITCDCGRLVQDCVFARHQLKIMVEKNWGVKLGR